MRPDCTRCLSACGGGAAAPAHNVEATTNNCNEPNITAHRNTSAIPSSVPPHCEAIQQANPLAEVGLEFGGLQDSQQILIFDPFECLRLIQIDQYGLFAVFRTFYHRVD